MNLNPGQNPEITKYVLCYTGGGGGGGGGGVVLGIHAHNYNLHSIALHTRV